MLQKGIYRLSINMVLMNTQLTSMIPQATRPQIHQEGIINMSYVVKFKNDTLKKVVDNLI